jgi:hypothetical protein
MDNTTKPRLTRKRNVAARKNSGRTLYVPAPVLNQVKQIIANYYAQQDELIAQFRKSAKSAA